MNRVLLAKGMLDKRVNDLCSSAMAVEKCRNKRTITGTLGLRRVF